MTPKDLANAAPAIEQATKKYVRRTDVVRPEAYKLGHGEGVRVREVLDAVHRATGTPCATVVGG